MIPAQKNKERKTNRILMIQPKEGMKAKSSTGLVDPRLFTGENNLHAIKNLESNLWSFKYDDGGLPEPLKERFTSFDNAYNAAKTYFNKRNLEITKVID